MRPTRPLAAAPVFTTHLDGSHARPQQRTDTNEPICAPPKGESDWSTRQPQGAPLPSLSPRLKLHIVFEPRPGVSLTSSLWHCRARFVDWGHFANGSATSTSTNSINVACQTLPAGPTKDIFAIHQFDTIALPKAFAQWRKGKGSG